MVTGLCPKCRAVVEVGSELEIGKRVICENCSTALEITWLFPICLDYQELSDDEVRQNDTDGII